MRIHPSGDNTHSGSEMFFSQQGMPCRSVASQQVPSDSPLSMSETTFELNHAVLTRGRPTAKKLPSKLTRCTISTGAASSQSTFDLRASVELRAGRTEPRSAQRQPVAHPASPDRARESVKARGKCGREGKRQAVVTHLALLTHQGFGHECASKRTEGPDIVKITPPMVYEVDIQSASGVSEEHHLKLVAAANRDRSIPALRSRLFSLFSSPNKRTQTLTMHPTLQDNPSPFHLTWTVQLGLHLI